jgi:hypothetical protein
VDTEKKPNQDTEQPKQDIGQMVGDLVVSGATVLAHSAVEAVVKRSVKRQLKPGGESGREGRQEGQEVGRCFQGQEQKSKESFQASRCEEKH